jgi:hypothetical protein
LSPCVQAESLITWQKTVFESYNCTIDFTKRLGSDSISINSVTAKDLGTGADSTSTFIAASQIIGMAAVFRVQNGINGHNYLVSVKILDNTTGEQFEGQVTLKVYDGTLK